MLAGGPIDFVAVDYKAPLCIYDGICGAGALGGAGVSETLDLLRDSGVAYEVRVTMIPHITEKKLVEMAESLPRLSHFVLQLYRPAAPDGTLRPVDASAPSDAGVPYTPGELHGLATAVRYAQPNVSVRI
jgi:pyruvate formate lyase activating enzyme